MSTMLEVNTERQALGFGHLREKSGVGQVAYIKCAERLAYVVKL